MEKLGIALLGLLAIGIHITAGYYWIFKPSFRVLKNIRNSEILSLTPLNGQERSALIIMPIVGYALWFFFKEMGRDLYIMPVIGVVQLFAFSAYFFVRLYKLSSNYLIRLLVVGLLFVGLLSCVILIFKLVCYFIVCITVGWIFVVIPFVALSYYALFQAVAFLGMAIYKIVIEDIKTKIEYNQLSSFSDLYRWIFSGSRGLLIYHFGNGCICHWSLLYYKFKFFRRLSIKLGSYFND